MEAQLDFWNMPARKLPYRGQTARARASDPETSHEAAAAFEPRRLTAIQQDVLSFFRQVRRATDEELEDALGRKHPGFSTLRKRRTDLVHMGRLKDSGDRRVNRNGRKMVVWQLRAK